MIVGLAQRWWHCFKWTWAICFRRSRLDEDHCMVDGRIEGRLTWVGCECGEVFWEVGS